MGWGRCVNEGRTRRKVEGNGRVEGERTMDGNGGSQNILLTLDR